MFLKKVIPLILFFFFIVISVGEAATTDLSASEHHTIVIVPHFSFEDAKALIEKEEEPFLWTKANIGAMNVRPDGAYQYLNNMVTLAAGAKAKGVEMWNAYEVDETIEGVPLKEVMLQVIGEEGLETSGALLHPLFYKLQTINANTSYRAKIGHLGQMLKEGEVDRFVLGHSDTIDNKIRYGSLLTIDNEGKTDGVLASAVKANRYAPFAMEMDTEFILNELNQRRNEVNRSFFVIEWGDLFRLDQLKAEMKPSHYQAVKERQLARLQDFLQEVIGGSQSSVWLLAPMMDTDSFQRKEQLAPVFYWGEEVDGGGFLTSPTTRQTYLVGSIDFVPTVLSQLKLSQEDLMLPGKPMVIEHSERLSHEGLFSEVSHIVQIFKTRSRVLSIFILSLVALLFAAGFVFIFLRKNQLALMWVKVTLLAAWCSLLFFLLLVPFSRYLNEVGFLALLIGCSMLLGFLIYRFCKVPISVAAGLVFVALTVDVLTGGALIQRSYLGFDPIIGARYYGIGNEYGGVYIIAVMAMLVHFLSRKKTDLILVSTVLLFLLFVLASQAYGTNAGGTLSAAIAYAVLVMKMYSGSIQTKTLWMAGFFALIGGVVLLYMMQLLGVQSHIGLAFERLLSGDFVYIQDMIIRKLTMNYKILRHSNWTLLFATSYLVVAVLIWRTRKQFLDVRKRLFLQAGVIASIALLLLNDSGVVAAATSMFCVVASYCYWLLENFQVTMNSELDYRKEKESTTESSS
ncbi:hypothetical protein AJ85_08985 [Alkalihalobacillus alcalophilus ATCC 27647 = CGMCC 1.3604]|uniref:Uncharacterized protein n=1 Tax=Alkalihalobacillus alcalophilus ATCC 27647 = CGMCC 1.3604 TaxID=1218173 RepID=A0A4S4JZM0_ALKAL|nr:hypothetical protein AJ85_08985 [Alkalihalobacillus alcalophilus ATCC 27647 = CGMCC 1.3604]